MDKIGIALPHWNAGSVLRHCLVAEHAKAYGVQVQLGAKQLQRPRQWGACWLACQLYEQLGLDRFWAGRLPDSREGTRWRHVLQGHALPLPRQAGGPQGGAVLASARALAGSVRGFVRGAALRPDLENGQGLGPSSFRRARASAPSRSTQRGVKRPSSGSGWSR